MKFTKTCLFLALGILQASASTFNNMDVVLRAGEAFSGMNGGYPVFRGCQVKPQNDGNFAVGNGFLSGGWDSNQGSVVCGGNQNKGFRLQVDGNFVTTCGGQVDYATNTGQGSNGDYLLTIDNDCILHIFEGTLDCNSIDIGNEIWSSVRKEPLQANERLGQGEYVLNEEDGSRLVMQSSDGNLVLYDASGAVTWAANTDSAWGSGPTSRMDNYFAFITASGHLTLNGIDLTGGNPDEVYFDKDLAKPAGETCFTVEFVSGDLIAVPCTRRNLQLRGSQV